MLRNLQISARIIGIGAGGFHGANTWFTDATGTITGTPGLHRLDHRAAADRGRRPAADPDVPQGRHDARRASAWRASSRCSCSACCSRTGAASSPNLPQYTGGVTAAHIAARPAQVAGLIATSSNSFFSNIFSTTVFPLMLSVLLFQFIGFQYSAYIAGEVRGNVRRGVLIALIGALVIGVLANSVYVDAISSHFGFNTQRQLGRQLLGLQHAACRRCRSASRTRCRCWRWSRTTACGRCGS